jgi:hypothetical protein
LPEKEGHLLVVGRAGAVVTALLRVGASQMSVGLAAAGAAIGAFAAGFVFNAVVVSVVNVDVGDGAVFVNVFVFVGVDIFVFVFAAVFVGESASGWA